MMPADHISLIVQMDDASDHVRIGAELLLPGVMRQDDPALRPARILAAPERPAQRRPDAEHVEELRGDICAAEVSRLALAAQLEHVLAHAGEGFEGPRAAGEIEKVRRSVAGIAASR